MRNPNEPDNNYHGPGYYYNGGQNANQNGYNNGGYNSSYNSSYNDGYQSYSRGYAPTDTSQGFARYMAKTYLWMFFGLAITFGLAFYMTIASGDVVSFLENNLAMYGIAALLSVIFAFTVGLFVTKLPPLAAKIIFIVYSADIGIITAPVLLMYELRSVVEIFAVTAVMYLVLAVIGLTSKRDMSKFGVILSVALIILLIYSLISMFFIRTPMNNIIINCAGVLIFMGFTIYDNNKIKKSYYAFSGNAEALEKLSIIGALQMYLDYINLFLYLLRLFGKRRN